jgi:hypothetical protein
MTYPQLDRSRLRMESLASRENRITIAEDHVDPATPPAPLSGRAADLLGELLARIRSARQAGCPVILAFGAHTIKNGLGPVLIRLLEEGWITHLATNGAAIIHDWEFSFLGQSSEHVGTNVVNGRFGNWEETGRLINLAINVGAYEGKGYGEAVGSLIENDGLVIPSVDELRQQVGAQLASNPEQAAAAADLLSIVERFHLLPGRLSVPHPWKRFSAQAAALRRGVPFTGHVMIGHDIIYNHPMNHGASLGRAALRDFLRYAHSVSNLEGGVYLSVGSAVMSPMIFEKSLSMSQNLALQAGRRIENHYIFVVDLAASTWDWTKGEPPETDAAYYQRYNKTFSRMGGTLRYLQLDNRELLLHLTHGLTRTSLFSCAKR